MYDPKQHGQDCQCDTCVDNRYWQDRKEAGDYVPLDSLANHEPREEPQLHYRHWENTWQR